MPSFKSILKPENSIVAGVATVGVVYGIYSTHVGTGSEVGMSPPNQPQIGGNIKTAGLVSLVAVGGISLLAKDANIWILGMAAIVALHAHYMHQNGKNPNTGYFEVMGKASAYQPAGYAAETQLQAVA